VEREDVHVFSRMRLDVQVRRFGCECDVCGRDGEAGDRVHLGILITGTSGAAQANKTHQSSSIQDVVKS